MLIYITSTIILAYVFLDFTFRLWKRKLSFLPSRPNVPWLGSLPFISPDIEQGSKDRVRYSQKFNHCYVVWFFHIPIIVASAVEYVEPLLKSRDNITKSQLYDGVKSWLGEGLLISTGRKWKSRRHALTGAFHFSILNDFLEIFEKNALNLVNKLLEVSSGGESVELQRLLSLATLDTICETAMGYPLDALNSSESEYVTSVERIKTLIMQKEISIISGTRFIYPYTKNGKEHYRRLKTLHDFTNGVINEKIATRQKAESGNRTDATMRKRRVFIDILLDLYDEGEIDIEGMREEVDTFMFEGHDTTASGLSWTLYEIGRRPEMQQRLFEEIEQASAMECPFMDKIRSLKYLECFIKESMRLHPPVPAFSRKLVNDITVNGNVIPSGAIMSLDVMSLHLNPAYWTEPTVFNPQRFQEDKYMKRNPYCYIPFSAGARNCIGQKFALLEEKTFLYHILSNFFIESLQHPEEIKVAFQLVTNSLNGIHVKCTKRM